MASLGRACGTHAWLTFGGSLRAVRLHGDMCIQVVERAICLLATIPPALVHSLNFFISTARSLVLLSTWNRNEGIDLANASVKSRQATQAKIT